MQSAISLGRTRTIDVPCGLIFGSSYLVFICSAERNGMLTEETKQPHVLYKIVPEYLLQCKTVGHRTIVHCVKSTYITQFTLYIIVASWQAIAH
jgi:hypothetical protein